MNLRDELTLKILDRMTSCQPHERTDRALAAHLGVQHHNKVHRRVMWLRQQGYIKNVPNTANTRTVTFDGREALRWQARFQ